MFRIGFGYDAHKLVQGRKLILGGVELPYEKGLEGHSDADVLTHAVTDALIGALGMGDLGMHFPDRDPEFKDACSTGLLKRIVDKAREKGYFIGNVDATVCAQEPRLAPYVQDMKRSLADVMRISAENVNVKATTTEKMGFPGRGEGIEAYAVILIQKSAGT